jgi:hypothetical protein
MQRDVNVRGQMFAMISLWQQSGLTQKAYCEEHGVRYHVFHYWYKCFRDLQSPAKDEGFIPLKIQPSNSVNTCCAHVELLLADGKRLLFHQPVSSDYLKALIS